MQLIGGLVAGDPAAAYQGSQRRGLDLEEEQQNIALKKQALETGGIGLTSQQLLGSTDWSGLVPGARPVTAGPTGYGGPVSPDPYSATLPDGAPGAGWRPGPQTTVGPGGAILDDPDIYEPAPVKSSDPSYDFSSDERRRQQAYQFLAEQMRAAQQPSQALALQPPAQPPGGLPPQLTQPPAGPGAQPVPMQAPVMQPSMMQPRPMGGQPQQPQMVQGPPRPQPQPQQPPVQAQGGGGPQMVQGPPQAGGQGQIPGYLDPIQVYNTIKRSNPNADPRAIWQATEQAMKVFGTSAQAHLYGPSGAYGLGRSNVAQLAAAYMAPPFNLPKDQAILKARADLAETGVSATIQPAMQKRVYGDFHSPNGTAGKNISSVNTLADHLTTLGTLSKGLKNGHIRAINEIAQKLAEATGQPAPTEFNVARTFVAGELVKLLASSNAGTREDRAEAGALFSRANSPEQLQGAINTAQKLVVGRLKALNQAWKAAGFEAKEPFGETFLLPEARKFFSIDVKPKGGQTSRDPAATPVDEGKVTNWGRDAQGNPVALPFTEEDKPQTDAFKGVKGGKGFKRSGADVRREWEGSKNVQDRTGIVYDRALTRSGKRRQLDDLIEETTGPRVRIDSPGP